MTVTLRTLKCSHAELMVAVGITFRSCRRRGRIIAGCAFVYLYEVALSTEEAEG